MHACMGKSLNMFLEVRRHDQVITQDTHPSVQEKETK